MVRLARLGIRLRWIVAGLLLAVGLLVGSWSPHEVFAGPGLNPDCNNPVFNDYLNWVKATPNPNAPNPNPSGPTNALAYTLVSNQTNNAVIYARSTLIYTPAPIFIHPTPPDSFVSRPWNAGVDQDLSNFNTYPCGLFTCPFNPNNNDSVSLTIKLDGTISFQSTNLGNIDFTWDCNGGALIGRSQNPWFTTVLISLAKITIPPPPK